MDLISIIIPIYNVDVYLPFCLESIINQSYKSIEIILVNDGSIDNCAKICSEYSQKDDRIIVITQTNMGVSSARNQGLMAANGDYIVFIDSDDQVSYDFIDYLHNMFDLHPSIDISVCGSIQVRDVKSGITFEIDENYRNDTCITIESKNAIKMLLLDDISPMIWAKMYKRKTINKLFFREDISLGEDTLFLYSALSKCDRLCISKNVKYYYNKRDGSLLNSKFNINKLSYLISLEEIRKIVINNYPSFKSHYYFYYCYSNLFLLNVLLKANNCNQHKEIEKLIIRNIRQSILKINFISHTNIIQFKKIIACVLPIISTRMYKIFLALIDIKY